MVALPTPTEKSFRQQPSPTDFSNQAR
jgi:hypothetical protein